MKFRHINTFRLAIIALTATCSLAGCDSQLDIIPKGQSTLGTVTDLEMLFNQSYDLGVPYNDIGIICNESLGQGENVPLKLSQKSTLSYAMLAYDESVDRANLTLTDDRYGNAYKYINYMNTIIEKMPEAAGDESKKEALIAEAHVMRAYLHWILVNIYARQYDAATADTDGGIAYVTDLNVTEIKKKATVAEVYDKILADCSDTYINALPVTHSDVLRGDQAWGNAVRAKVLMQMKRYADALPYAKKALDLNGTIEDRSGTVDAGDWILTKQAGSNYIYFGTMVAPFTEVISPETAARFERGDYVKDYAFLFGMKPGEGGEDDDDDDAEEWDAKATLLKAKDVINGIKAKRKSDAQNTDITDETGPTDDEIGDEGDEYVAPNAANPAWSELFGMMNSGVIGAAQYYSINANVNCYGITSDRMYYTLAECLIRTGKTDEGLELVNQVRRCRISPDQYAPLTASTETEAMEQLQRSKWIECLCTYENFFDCKRWNSEEKYRRTITRTIMDMEGNISTFEIAPDSKLWILPFPLNVTRKNPTLTQNY